MRLKINKPKQKGDTIVEVLIAIAIISLILSLSYGLANRSSQATRMAQERSEALKIGEDQVESLKAYLEDNKDTGIPGGGFCVVQSSGNFSIVPSSSSSCKKGPQDTPGVGRYRINITKDGDLYRINLEWDTVSGGTVDDTLTLTYRLSPTDIDYVDEPPDVSFACSDGVDNDGDRKTDLDDPQCPTPTHNDESSPPPPVNLTVVNPGGAGRVTGPGINCGQGNNDCSQTYILATSLSLNATPAASYRFNNWSPASCGNFVITSNTTCRANFSYIPRKPLYRCYSIHVGADIRHVTDHHYGVPGAGSCYPSIHNDAWWIYYEGIAGYVPADGSYPSAPVYGGWSSDRCGGWINPWPWWDHFYTTNYQEYVNAHYMGWCNETGYQGWSVLTDGSAPGSVPLYRFWHGGVGDHFYTTNWGEGANAGYSYEGIFGWVYASP